jgi:nucleotidyltransferase/DNA polymerase involved in DNA repair
LYNFSGAHKVEPVSVDEAYLEFLVPSPRSLTSGSVSSTDGTLDLYPLQFGMAKAQELRDRIFRETGCTAR